MTQTPRSSLPGDGAAATSRPVRSSEGLADQAQAKAGQVAEQAKQQATSQLESQKGRAVDTLATVVQALRETGQQLQQQEQGAVGEYVEQAAERVERVTNHLRARDVPELIADTQEFRSQAARLVCDRRARARISGRPVPDELRSTRGAAAFATPTTTPTTADRHVQLPLPRRPAVSVGIARRFVGPGYCTTAPTIYQPVSALSDPGRIGRLMQTRRDDRSLGELFRRPRPRHGHPGTSGGQPRDH